MFSFVKRTFAIILLHISFLESSSINYSRISSVSSSIFPVFLMVPLSGTLSKPIQLVLILTCFPLHSQLFSYPNFCWFCLCEQSVLGITNHEGRPKHQENMKVNQKGSCGLSSSLCTLLLCLRPLETDRMGSEWLLSENQSESTHRRDQLMIKR